MSSHPHSHNQNKLGFTIMLNIVITVAQVIGGVISGSLALISDALHNLSDALAVILAWIAGYLAGKPRTQRSSFGFQRAEILAAFINALVLIAISVYLLAEAIRRFVHPEAVDPAWMFWLGLLGMFANGISVFLLHDGRRENINIKAAYLHLMGDMLTSAAVVAGAIFIHFLGWYWVDPMITLLISIYLMIHTWSILKESIEILMQMSPAGIDAAEVGQVLAGVDGVQGIHHIHIWKLSDTIIHFEGHVVLSADILVSETAAVHHRMKQLLKERYQIQHVTFQFEYKNKPEPECDS